MAKKENQCILNPLSAEYSLSEVETEVVEVSVEKTETPAEEVKSEAAEEVKFPEFQGACGGREDRFRVYWGLN